MQAKIENSLESIRHLRSTIFRLIGVPEQVIVSVANFPG
jgi:hypothetical protein